MNDPSPYSLAEKVDQIGERIKENLYTLEDTLPIMRKTELRGVLHCTPRISKKPHLKIWKVHYKFDVRFKGYMWGNKIPQLQAEGAYSYMSSIDFLPFDQVFQKLKGKYLWAVRFRQEECSADIENMFSFYLNLPEIMKKHLKGESIVPDFKENEEKAGGRLNKIIGVEK